MSNCRAPRWHSPLVKLLRRARENKTLPCRLKNLERKVAFPCAPWYVHPEIVIAPTREASIAIYDAVIQCPDTLAIYTDASGIKGLVGAVAVIPATKQISHLHMGQLKTHNSVYGGELQGIRLGLDMVHETILPQKKLAVFTDNQAAIQSNHNSRYQNGQYIIIETVRTIEALQAQGYSIILYWISAHNGVAGNEQAYTEAK